MASYLTITFLPERKEITWFPKFNCFYLMEDDGYEVLFSTWPAWCNQCQTVRDAEVIHSLEKLQQELERLENDEYAHCSHAERLEAWKQKYGKQLDFAEEADLERLAQSSHEHYEWSLLRARRFCDWRRLRQSSPRCLECGGTDIVRFPTCEAPGNSPEGISPVGLSGLLFAPSLLIAFFSGCLTDFAWHIWPQKSRKWLKSSSHRQATTDRIRVKEGGRFIAAFPKSLYTIEGEFIKTVEAIPYRPNSQS